MASESLRLSVAHEGVQHVSMLVDRPPAEADVGTVALVLAHGAGASMTSAFMEGLATRLAALGLPVLRFNYAYMELMQRGANRRPPDRRAVLETIHRAAIEDARERFAGRKLLLGGKSMGGRIASYLAAADEPCAGLVFYGYPLHPAGKPDKQRSEHFPALVQPALFLSGDRDALADLALLHAALETYGGRASVSVVECADHGFDVLRRSGRRPEDVLDELARETLAWVRATFPE